MAIATTDFKNGITWTGGGNGDTAVFTVLGGRYALAAHASAWGTLDVDVLMPDGSTYIAIATQMTADGSQLLDLPAGTYKLVLATVTACQGFICPVPYRAFSG